MVTVVIASRCKRRVNPLLLGSQAANREKPLLEGDRHASLRLARNDRLVLLCC